MLFRSLIDGIDGLVNVAPTDLADLSSLKGAKLDFLEQQGNKYFLVDANNGSIYSYDSTTGGLSSLIVNPAGVGKVTATAVGDDGLFLMTDEPAVWLYQSDGNKLTKQTIILGSWPRGKALGTYGGNLYILAADDSQIYKDVKTVGGYGGKSNYLIANTNLLAGASAMGIDGNIYTAGPQGFVRFALGKLDSQVKLPDTLTHADSIVSAAGGDLLLVSDAQSGRVGVIDGTNQLVLTRQLKVSGNPHLYAIRYDSGSRSIIALTDGKLIKIPLPQ